MDHDIAASQIALTGIEPEVPSFRVLTSDTSDEHGRQDPEYYITANGPSIYYNRYLMLAGGVARRKGYSASIPGLAPRNDDYESFIGIAIRKMKCRLIAGSFGSLRRCQPLARRCARSSH
ncbi:MAG: hypothetical protein U1F20_06900 [Lysobacterales bacterium]